MLKFVKNNLGVTLVEVLVSAGMTAIVAVGIATMMSSSAQEARKAVLLDTLKNQKQRFEFLIRDQAAWTKTTADTTLNTAALFTQIRATTAITAVPYTAPIKIVLFDAAGAAVDLLGPASTTGNGFTEKGATCTTFSTTTGTDACPFSYRLLIAAVCPSAAASCANPQIKVVARLVYNPASSGTLNNFKNLIQAIAGSDISDTVADGKYDASVKRTTSTTNRSFRIFAGFTNTTGTGASFNCTSGEGAGACSPAASGFAVHPLSWAEDYDPNNLVSVSGQSITFAETGYYGCTIAVPAFATQGFIAKLRNINTATDIASASTMAGLWSQTTAVIEAKFNVTNVADAYQIFQQCDVLPNGTPSANNCTLGMSNQVSPYTAAFQTIMTMSCYKLDRSM